MKKNLFPNASFVNRKPLRSFFLSLVFLLVGVQGFGQTAVAISSFPWSQATSAPFTNSKTLPTSFRMDGNGAGAVAAASDQLSTAAPVTNASGGSYVYYSSTAENSSIGYIFSNGYKPSSPKIAFAFKNNTGSTITSLNVSVDYRKLRAGTITEKYTLTGSSGTVPAGLSYTYSADASVATMAFPGTASKNTGTITGLNIANGATYTLTWTVTGANSSSHASGIGNIQLSVPETTNYTVAFNGNGSTSGTMADQSASAATSLTDNAFAKISPTYSFSGWASSVVNATAGTVAYANKASYPFTSSTTLYAIWGFNISYNVNSGTGSITDLAGYYNSATSTGTATLSSGTGFTKPGYSFGGWKTSASGTSANYAASDTYTHSGTSAAVTLYAHWIPNDNTITFDKNAADATGSTPSQTLATGTTANLTANGYTRSGYTFSGWATTAGGTVAYADGASYIMGTSNVTLYAVWTTLAPYITASGTLSDVSTVYGTASATPASFTVSAGNLTNNLIITPPSGFEVSLTSGGTYTTSVNLGTTITPNTPVYIRLAETTAFGTYSGNINLASGATTNTIATVASNVSKKTLTITGLTGSNKIYDGTTAASVSGTPAYSGLVNGETFSVTGTVTFSFINANVGTSKTINKTGSYDAPSGNYTVTQPTITADITAKELNITAPSIASRVYSPGVLTTGTISVGTLSGFVGTETVTATATGNYANADAGTGKTATVTYVLANGTNGGLAANYSLAQGSGTGNITKATPTYSSTSLSISLGTPQTISSSISNSPGALTFSSLDTGVATVGSTTGTVNGVAVGSTTINVTQAEDTNYFGGSTTVPVTVTDIAVGTYETTSNGTWPNAIGAATWRRMTSTGWENPTTRPAAGTTDLLIIKHTITTNANFAATGGTNMIVDANGVFNGGHSCTFNSLVIKNGGVFSVDVPGVTVKSTAPLGTLTVESGGKLILNSTTLDNSDGLWNGTENFMNGSTVELQNWDWDNSTNNANRLIGSTTQITPNSDGYYFGNLIINASPTENFSLIRNTVDPGEGNKIKLAQNNLEITNNAVSNIAVQLAIAAAHNVEIGGDVIVNNGLFRFASLGSSAVQHLIKGNLTINSSGIVQFNPTSGGGSFVSLIKNLDVKSGAQLNGTQAGSKLIFSGNAVLPQTINFAGTLGTQVDFEVNDKAEVQLINQNVNLPNSTNDFTVLTGGTLDFGFDSSFNPLNITGAGTFTSQSGSILKITSADGINKTGSVGNVQTTTRTYSNLGTYHFIGALTPQSTGNAFENTGTAAALNLVINKDNATDVVNLNTNTKTTGELNIIKGTFVETESSKIAGTTGKLTMSADATYRTAVTSASTPQLSGTYALATGSTIELNANANQTFNASNTITYRNLIFSNGGTKTIGNTNENILGTVTIKDNTTVDASSNTFGGAGTNLTMSDTSKLILGSGRDPKPRMDGVYNLGSASTIEFTGDSSTQIRVQTTSTNPIPYAKVIVSGTNVKAGTTSATGLTFQSGGVFTVTGTGVYKVPNPAGFSGGTVTSIKNTNNPTINLETGSTIEYNATADQTITVGTVAIPATGNYQNLAISGSGTKSPVASLTVNNLVKITGGVLKITGTEENAPANVLYAYKGIDNTGGTVIFENNAQLLQDTDAVNIGNVESQRLASNINNVATQMDYIYWSSPVSGQDLKQFSPGTPTNRIFQYNESTDYFTGVNFATEPNFIAGKGYAFRAETTVTNGSSKTYSFTGTPNNGTIGINVNRSADSSTGVVHGYNLVGNPYPSNINFEQLYLGNSSVIWNTAYFWTNNSFTPTQMGSDYSDYTPNNYAIYNGTGGNAATKAASGEGVTAVPNGIVKVGQGFIIQKKNLGSSVLEFKNSYSPTNILRVPDNGTFFEKGVSKNRFWLEMLAPNNLVNSILVGYIPGATNDFENDFDGELLVVGSDSFYSVLGAKKLAIQGKSGDFSTEDVVPLGNVYSAEGNYTIKLKDPEGIFTNNQNVYLRDKLLNKYINLNSAGSYTFAVTKGTDNTRFEIVYKEDAVLGTGNESKSEFIVYRDGNEFVIKSSKSLGKVEVYDAVGRMIMTQKTNDKILRLNVSTLNDGIFIIKAENSGDIKTKKILK